MSQYKTIAVKAAKKAGKILVKHYEHLSSVEYKDADKKDMVTIADRASEVCIRSYITKIFPNHGFLGEEFGSTNKDAEFIWIIDPLDGTSNYVQKIPIFSVSIALWHNGKVILGVIFSPITKELYVAERGKGALKNNKKISVSEVSNIEESICAIEHYSKDDVYRERGYKNFLSVAQRAKKMRYLSSVAYEMCKVAEGSIDTYVTDTFLVDIAAASIIVTEAGGVCTYSDNRTAPSDLENTLQRIIVSNGKIHSEIKNLLV